MAVAIAAAASEAQASFGGARGWSVSLLPLFGWPAPAPAPRALAFLGAGAGARLRMMTRVLRARRWARKRFGVPLLVCPLLTLARSSFVARVLRRAAVR